MSIMGSWSRVVLLVAAAAISAAVTSTPSTNQKRDFFKQLSPKKFHETISRESYENINHEDRNDLDSLNALYKVDFTKAEIWRVSTENGKWQVLNELEDKNLISIWRIREDCVDVFVPAHKVRKVKTALNKENFTYKVLLIGIEIPPDFDENSIIIQKSVGHSMDWKQYHRLEDIHGYLDYLAKSYPEIVSVKSIGKTFEGRDLKLIKISNGSPSNKAVFIDGGIHAREWISPATVTYFINQIVENFNTQDDNVKNTDWYFLPVLNPDGYEYTHTDNRLWRKNRRPGKKCYGVDINRNFGFKWGGKGTTRNPCDETYIGEKAFSEPESKALKDFFESTGVKFNAYLTYHSYGQCILHPWGYDEVVPPDMPELFQAGLKMAAAIQSVGNDSYSVEPAYSLSGPQAGASDDWAKSVGVKYSYTIELNDRGEYGFLLPPEYIEPVAKENLAGLKAMLAVIHGR